MTSRLRAAGTVPLLTAGGAIWMYRKFAGDMYLASAQAVQDSVLARTRFGAIEYRAQGQDPPLLVTHGAGGGIGALMACWRSGA